ncbi:GDSL esterase/lipase At2g04570-like isoform X2 [Miscanthus floridulus]|uniref:GDSL esterase/lipase At2g04570-like isoform X2 n=1 Tax=Miscanthus floridulus TaxID=154761 RepID=UPI0034578CEF
MPFWGRSRAAAAAAGGADGDERHRAGRGAAGAGGDRVRGLHGGHGQQQPDPHPAARRPPALRPRHAGRAARHRPVRQRAAAPGLHLRGARPAAAGAGLPRPGLWHRRLRARRVLRVRGHWDRQRHRRSLVIPLWKEVDYYEEYQRRLRARVGASRAAAIVGGALHVVSIGTNDFLENYFMPLATGRSAQFTVPEFEDFLVAGARQFLARIHHLGARRVTFAGLAAIGCLPLERTTNALRGGGCVEEYNDVARSFNAKLQAMVRGLRDEFPRLKLVYVSVYESFLRLITNPQKFGLENVEEGCCATGRFEMGIMCNDDAPLTCDDASKYLFWDAFHPTEKVNRLMANNTLQACYQQGVL